MKTVYDLHRFWTSMSAIFGLTFHIGRMTEVLIPYIYIYIVFTSKRLPLQPVSSEWNHQVILLIKVRPLPLNELTKQSGNAFS